MPTPSKSIVMNPAKAGAAASAQRVVGTQIGELPTRVRSELKNPGTLLKPGMFATASIQQANKTLAVLVPASAIQTIGGTSRVYVVSGDRVEERVVTTGQKLDPLVEIVNGLKSGERVATTNVTKLIDGMKVN